jgi:hypothetical protein
MKQSKSFFVFLFTAIGLLNLQCSEDDGVVLDDSELLSGEWKINNVTYDGMIQAEWAGTTLTFTRLAQDSGSYKLSHSPADSIWNSIGSWKDIDSKRFVREDQIEVMYWREQDTRMLILDFYLPWTRQSTCDDGICLPVVTGQWNFALER